MKTILLIFSFIALIACNYPAREEFKFEDQYKGYTVVSKQYGDWYDQRWLILRKKAIGCECADTFIRLKVPVYVADAMQEGEVIK